jgi:hypothetical protein
VTNAARKKFALFAGILTIILLLPQLGRPLVLVLTLAIVGRCAYELYASLQATSPAFRTAVCSAYALLGIAFLCFAIALPLKSISYVCAIILAFSLRRYGLPRLGLTGGALAALAAAILVRDGMGAAGAIESGIAVIAAALAGALAGAWLRSRSGVKGFGGGGRSGVLDYFESFLFAAPVALAVLTR